MREHRHQPVRAGPGDAESGGGVGDAQPTAVAQQQDP